MTTAPITKPAANTWITLASLLIGTLIGTMGNSMVSIALPSLMQHFDISLTSAVWSMTVYTLTFSVFIPIFGVIGPSIGFKRLYMSGITLIIISSLLCILAPNFILFLVFRVMLGIGTATVLPTIMGIISQQVPTEMQGQATGYWALVNSLGHAIGPSLGGLLLQYISWQAIFLINIPLGLISLVLTMRFMIQGKRSTFKGFDVPGAAALTLLAFCTIFAITFSAQQGFGSITSISVWSGALLSLVFLLIYERRAPMPFVNMKLFSNKHYLACILPISLQAFSQFGLLVSLPFFLIDIRGMEDQTAGVIIMSMTLVMALISPVSGRLTDSWGSRKVSQMGTVFVIAATLPFLALRFLPLEGWVWGVFILGLLMYGAGFGFIQSSSTVAVIQAVPKELASAASGFFHMLRFISASLGSTIIGIILEKTTGGMADGFFLSFWLIVALAVIVFPLLRAMPAQAEPAL